MATGLGIKKRAWRALREAKDTYRDLGRFQRMRALIIVLLLADIAGTSAYVYFGRAAEGQLEVYYRADFPTRLLIVRNRFAAMAPARLVLDDRFFFSIPRLEKGPIGIDLRDFRDAQGLPPDDTYRPRQAIVESADNRFELEVGYDGGP